MGQFHFRELMTQIVDDEFKAFEAALAFIDECDNGSADFSSDCSGDSVHAGLPLHLKRGRSRSSIKSMTTNTKPTTDTQEIARLKAKLAIPGRNRSRDLHKLELLQLRVEAASLQEQVDQLHRVKAMKSGATYATVASRSGLARSTHSMLLMACESLAKRQMILRREAESENQNLRELVGVQMKTIRRMQALFQKLKVDKVKHRGLLAVKPLS